MGYCLGQHVFDTCPLELPVCTSLLQEDRGRLWAHTSGSPSLSEQIFNTVIIELVCGWLWILKSQVLKQSVRTNIPFGCVLFRSFTNGKCRLCKSSLATGIHRLLFVMVGVHVSYFILCLSLSSDHSFFSTDIWYSLNSDILWQFYYYHLIFGLDVLYKPWWHCSLQWNFFTCFLLVLINR